MNVLEKVMHHFQAYQGNTLFLVANLVVIVSTSLVLLSIFLDFIEFHHREKVKKKVNSWVETGSMFVYFGIYCLLLKLRADKLMFQHELIHEILMIIGIILVALGSFVNVKGRIDLQHNWANQVTVYYDHTLITKGMYKVVRHPLYASLIWMLIGGSFIYCNLIAFLSVVLIFIPMMFYRAKQEESLLLAAFPDYAVYRKNVGMFFPKIKIYGQL